MSNANLSLVRYNKVKFMTDDFADYSGIDVRSNRGFFANCNEVTSAVPSATTKGRVGIYVENVTGGSYECNNVDQTQRGIEFKTMCDASLVRGTAFNRHTNGLYLGDDVTLGTQGLDVVENGQVVKVQDHGNTWTANSGVSIHESSDQFTVALSAFGVDPQENPAFLPVTNQNDWFKLEPTPNDPTFACPACVPPPLPPAPPPYTGNDGLDVKIANGDIFDTDLPGVIPNMLENKLYARLMDDPAQVNNRPEYQQFLNAKAGSTTAQFYQIRKGIDALANQTPSEQAVLNGLEEQSMRLRTYLFQIDSVWQSGGAFNDSLNSVYLVQLSNTQQILGNELANIRSARLNDANALLDQNAAINTTQAWETYEKTVNDLAIRLFIQDSLSTAQLTQLNAIGQGCVHIEGEAVLRAQTLYNLFDDKDFRNLQDCTTPREGAMHKEPNAAAVLYPNPTTGLVFLPDAEGRERQISVVDMTGRIVAQTNTSTNQLDLSNLTNGIYFVHINDLSIGTSQVARLNISK